MMIKKTGRKKKNRVIILEPLEKRLWYDFFMENPPYKLHINNEKQKVIAYYVKKNTVIEKDFNYFSFKDWIYWIIENNLPEVVANLKIIKKLEDF